MPRRCRWPRALPSPMWTRRAGPGRRSSRARSCRSSRSSRPMPPRRPPAGPQRPSSLRRRFLRIRVACSCNSARSPRATTPKRLGSDSPGCWTGWLRASRSGRKAVATRCRRARSRSAPRRRRRRAHPAGHRHAGVRDRPTLMVGGNEPGRVETRPSEAGFMVGQLADAQTGLHLPRLSAPAPANTVPCVAALSGRVRVSPRD